MSYSNGKVISDGTNFNLIYKCTWAKYMPNFITIGSARLKALALTPGASKNWFRSVKWCVIFLFRAKWILHIPLLFGLVIVNFEGKDWFKRKASGIYSNQPLKRYFTLCSIWSTEPRIQSLHSLKSTGYIGPVYWNFRYFGQNKNYPRFSSPLNPVFFTLMEKFCFDFFS